MMMTIYSIRFAPFRSSDVSVHNQPTVRPNNCSTTNSIPCSDTKKSDQFAPAVRYAQPFHFGAGEIWYATVSSQQKPSATDMRPAKCSTAEAHLTVAARSRVALQALSTEHCKWCNPWRNTPRQGVLCCQCHAHPVGFSFAFARKVKFFRYPSDEKWRAGVKAWVN